MIPQLEPENRKQTDQNLRKEAINWINPSKSRAQSFDCIDAVDSFDYNESSKIIHAIGGRN
jgi:hypothetical protein